MKRLADISGYLVIILLSIGFIYIGRNYALEHQLTKVCYEKEVEIGTGVIAKVKNVEGTKSEDLVGFEAVILNGDQHDKTVQATQSVSGPSLFNPPKVEHGDLVVLYPIQDGESIHWLFQDYCRLGTIVIMFLVLLLLIIIICGTKGMTTLISLGFTFMYTMLTLIPMYTAGMNGYFATLIVSAGIVFSSLYIINGINGKSTASVLGCWAGLGFSALLAYWSSCAMKLTGYTGTDSSQLYQIFNNQLDMKAIVFTTVVLSSLGATMDVAMSIASALHEVKRNSSNLSRRMLFKSGMEIGKDTIGTMSNTLILAYLGGSLSSILIYSSMDYPLSILLNKQELIVEFSQSLIGVFSILVTIPITALCCSFMFYENNGIQQRSSRSVRNYSANLK